MYIFPAGTAQLGQHNHRLGVGSNLHHIHVVLCCTVLFPGHWGLENPDYDTLKSPQVLVFQCTSVQFDRLKSQGCYILHMLKISCPAPMPNYDFWHGCEAAPSFEQSSLELDSNAHPAAQAERRVDLCLLYVFKKPASLRWAMQTARFLILVCPSELNKCSPWYLWGCAKGAPENIKKAVSHPWGPGQLFTFQDFACFWGIVRYIV